MPGHVQVDAVIYICTYPIVEERHSRSAAQFRCLSDFVLWLVIPWSQSLAELTWHAGGCKIDY